MTRGGQGPGAVVAHTGLEKGGKVVYGDGSWQLTVFVTDLQVGAGAAGATVTLCAVKHRLCQYWK